MRIAYILEVNPYVQSGIIKKVADQVGYWTSQGHDVSVFMPWPKPTSESVLLINGIVLSARWVEGLPDGGVKNFANKVLCANRLRRALNELKPNILYIRQNMHFPGLSRMLKEHTTVLELNTVDVIEIGFHPFLRRKVYLSGRDKVLRAARGLVAVSPDILKHYATYRHLETERKLPTVSGCRCHRMILSKSCVEKPSFLGRRGKKPIIDCGNLSDPKQTHTIDLLPPLKIRK